MSLYSYLILYGFPGGVFYPFLIGESSDVLYGTYRGEDGQDESKPQINLNAKWLAEAGFHVGDQIDVAVAENELVIRKLIPA